MTHWTNRYIGIPQRDGGRDLTGIDCYGLACLIYREVAGIDLMSYAGAYISADEQAEVAALIANGKVQEPWMPIHGFALPLDIAIYREGRYESHLAVIAGDGLILHVGNSGASRIERMGDARFADRLAGIYRHRDLALRGIQ